MLQYVDGRWHSYGLLSNRRQLGMNGSYGGAAAFGLSCRVHVLAVYDPALLLDGGFQAQVFYLESHFSSSLAFPLPQVQVPRAPRRRFQLLI